MSYENPIYAICSEIKHKIMEDEEENLMLEVQKAIGYYVDKDELIKALRYDRNQYEKGFEDGKPKWIPVSERLPKESEYCLCCDKNGYMAIGCISKWSKEEWRFDDDETDMDVVAWMPLPEPYKEVEDERYFISK